MSQPRPTSGRRLKTGVPEIDAILRKIVYRQGGWAERASHGILVYGPKGQGPEFVTASKVRRTSLGAIRSSLRRVGLKP